MAAKIEVKNADEIRKRMRKVMRNVWDDVSQTYDDLADELLTMARDRAPVLTGRLIASSKVDAVNMRLQGRISRKIRFWAPYAKYQDKYAHNPGPGTAAKLGASFGVAQGYLTKTQKEFRPTVKRRLGQSVERAVRQSLR